MKITDFAIPLMILCIISFGMVKKVDVFEEFVGGAKEGIQVALRILPTLIGLLTAIGMLKASGAIDVLTYGLRGFADLVQVPKEVMPLALLRPISGSGALAVLENMLTSYGPDSTIGRVASVMQGSTETTFYTIAVYFSATKTLKTRHTLPSALAGDLTGIVVSALAVRLFLGS